LVAAGEGIPESKARQDACGAVLGPIGMRMARHAEMIRARVRSSGTVEQLYCTINMLRGVASTTGSTFEIAFGFLQTYFGGLVSLIGMFGTESRVVTSILKLFRDLAATEVGFLNGEQQIVLMRSCVEVVAQFGRVNTERLTRLRTGTGLVAAAEAKEAEQDQFSDVTTLLKLLSHLISSEMGSLERDAVQSASDAALQGLMILAPHLSENMLKYPEICQAYFSLLRDLVTTHVDKFASLPSEARSTMIGSLTLGINHYDVIIARDGLTTLNELGVFHFRCRRAAMGIPDEPEPVASTPSRSGRLPVERKSPAKSPSSVTSPPAGSVAASMGASPFGDDLVTRHDFMARVLNILLFERTSPLLLEPLADALLPLVVAEPEHYSATVDRLIAAKLLSTDDTVRRRVWNGFKELVTTKLARNTHKSNRFQFRANVRRLVESVRSFLQQK
jgi:hypothetical protein